MEMNALDKSFFVLAGADHSDPRLLHDYLRYQEVWKRAHRIGQLPEAVLLTLAVESLARVDRMKRQPPLSNSEGTTTITEEQEETLEKVAESFDKGKKSKAPAKTG